ncbi:MAG: glycosyltransferase family 4 protein [Planctomycetota bacterium]
MPGYEIAFLLGYPEISGGTNVILEHALGLTRHGHRVWIVTAEPIDPRRLAWKPGVETLPLLAQAECRGRKFDLAIATWWRSVYDLPSVPARRYAYFCQSIESRFFTERDPDAQALAEYTYRQPLPIVTEAAWIAVHLRELYGREATLVRNGIDKQIFRPDGEAVAPRRADGLRVLVEGALRVPFKRVEWTIELCRRAGVAELWLLTPTACTGYPGVQRVLSQAPLPEVGRIMRSCDVLVKLSTVEGMFGPPLEMMHCGGTAITTDVTGHEEYMRHGENGLVVRRGEEAEVIKHLRALARDRGLLEHLKAGARQTAEEWPDWTAAVREFELFVRGVCETERNAAAVRDEMLAQLTAALRLAGPLHGTIRPDPSGTELLRKALAKARRKVLRKLGLIRADDAVDAVQPASPGTPEQITPVPALEHRPPEVKRPVRLCFVGDARRFAAHAASAPRGGVAHFVDIGKSAELRLEPALGVVRDFGPDFTLVFEPEHIPPEFFDQLCGYVVGYAVASATIANIAAWLARFPAERRGTRGLLHADTDVVPESLAAGVYAIGALPLPVDAARFGTPVDPDDWRAREVDVLICGTPADDRLLAAVRDLPNVLHIPEPPADAALAGVLRRTKLVLHAPAPEETALDAAKALRDALCGALVLGGRFRPDYGLMPGEHYVYFDGPEGLVSAVRRQLAFPDKLDVMRRCARQIAERHDANLVYADLADRLTGAGPLTSDWAGHVSGRPAAAPAEVVRP